MTRTVKKQGVSAREAARQLGTHHSYLLRLTKEARLPRYGDGSFDVEHCRHVLAAIADPAQVRGGNPNRWSPRHRSMANMAASRHSAAISYDPVPVPAEYRDRTDLGDDFIRGALYGMHAVIYGVPQLIACELAEHGCTTEAALEAYREQSGEYADCLLSYALLRLGLITQEQEEPGSRHPYVPTRFAGVNLAGFGGAR